MTVQHHISCVRKIGFDAGHRVVNHESKCANWHGHRYTAEIYACSDGLDEIGRVIDFSVIKELVGGWIDKQWDHNLIMFKDDPDFAKVAQLEGPKKPFILPVNPTAENMAAYLIDEVIPKLLVGTGVIVPKIRLWETPNCYVEVERFELHDGGKTHKRDDGVIEVHEEI